MSRYHVSNSEGQYEKDSGEQVLANKPGITASDEMNEVELVLLEQLYQSIFEEQFPEGQLSVALCGGLINLSTWTEVICLPHDITGALMKKQNFSAEFKTWIRSVSHWAELYGCRYRKAMNVGLSTMTQWVKQLRDERAGKTPKASPITPEQIEIREPKKKLQRIKMEN